MRRSTTQVYIKRAGELVYESVLASHWAVKYNFDLLDYTVTNTE